MSCSSSSSSPSSTVTTSTTTTNPSPFKLPFCPHAASSPLSQTHYPSCIDNTVYWNCGHIQRGTMTHRPETHDNTRAWPCVSPQLVCSVLNKFCPCCRAIRPRIYHKGLNIFLREVKPNPGNIGAWMEKPWEWRTERGLREDQRPMVVSDQCFLNGGFGRKKLAEFLFGGDSPCSVKWEDAWGRYGEVTRGVPPVWVVSEES